MNFSVKLYIIPSWIIFCSGVDGCCLLAAISSRKIIENKNPSNNNDIVLWGFLYYVISVSIFSFHVSVSWFLPSFDFCLFFLYVWMCVRALFCWYTIFFSFPFFLSPEEPIGMFYMGRCSIYTSLSLSNWNSNKKKVEREIINYPSHNLLLSIPCIVESFFIITILSLLSQFRKVYNLNCHSPIPTLGLFFFFWILFNSFRKRGKTQEI